MVGHKLLQTLPLPPSPRQQLPLQQQGPACLTPSRCWHPWRLSSPPANKPPTLLFCQLGRTLLPCLGLQRQWLPR
jgi:hypothetical protein